MAPLPKSKGRVNPIRNQREVRAPTPLLRKATNNAASRPAKRLCPNKECYAPNINDEGTCINCGTIVHESNIVNEVSFGEDSRGAAVLQGSYVGEGQGAARSMGPGFTRGAGVGESRLATIREGRQHIDGLAAQFNITSETDLQQSYNLFKLVTDSNFNQGRRIDMVAAVCLYTVCRSRKGCSVMLIDFADRLQVNVFKLGHTFKALHKQVTMPDVEIIPIVPEDLMFRFASKLEFGELTLKVAEDAVRLSKRMDKDWMNTGRRPSGICGACIILAARMNNFRRTVTEVVYIVKVTTATIQKRLEEFKLTPSAQLTVNQFFSIELESQHDPPSFYQQQPEFIKNKKTRKRKRVQLFDDEEENREESEADLNKRQKTATPNPDDALAPVELRRDADGFAIPAQPATVPGPRSEFDRLVDKTAADPTDEAMHDLIEEFGEIEARTISSDDEDDAASPIESTPKRDGRRGPRYPEVHVPEPWARDEQRIEDDIRALLSDPKNSALLSDPNTSHHATLYAMAEKRSKKHKENFERANPRKEVRDEEEISESEFADDPEVQNCLLNEEDVARKEKVWVNENKNWLRKQQIKAYQKRIAANGPPKKTRNRTKGIRIGELQTSPASSAGEAAVLVMQKRALSKKINYQNIETLFDDMDIPGGGTLGSTATSRVTSRAGSSAPESPSTNDSVANDRDSATPQAETSNSQTTIPTPGLIREDEVPSDEDDYVGDDGQRNDQPEGEQDFWKRGNRDRGVEEGEDDEEFGDDDGYDDIGDDGGIPDVWGDDEDGGADYD